MKKKIYRLTQTLVAALLAVGMSSCSDTVTGGATSQTERIGASKCYSIETGNLLTANDVVISEDTTNVLISKTMFKHVYGDEQLLTNDVIGLYIYGQLAYLQANNVKTDESGLFYVCDVKKIDLEEVLGLCDITMENINLSTDIYVDTSKPKRVSNDGKADDTGIINAEYYMEKQEDGTIVYHPEVVTVPTLKEGKNEDDDDAFEEDSFIGCYVGQSDESVDPNGLIDKIKQGGKACMDYVDSKVKKVIDIAKGAKDLICAIAKGGEFKVEQHIVDIDEEFSAANKNQNIHYTFDKQSEGDAITMQDAEETAWRVKGAADINLDGHVKAWAGIKMVLTFKPRKVEKFTTTQGAMTDIDLKSDIQMDANGTYERSKVLHDYTPRIMKFAIGPVPIIITIYPSLVWNTSASGNLKLATTATTKCKFNLTSTIQAYPEWKTTWPTKEEMKPTFSHTFNTFDATLTGTVKTGPALRAALNLYGLTGPVFEVGTNIQLGSDNKNAEFRIYKTKEGKWKGKGKFDVNVNLAELGVAYNISFPPLRKISEEWYKKLSWESARKTFNPLSPYTLKSYDSSTDTSTKDANGYGTFDWNTSW